MEVPSPSHAVGSACVVGPPASQALHARFGSTAAKSDAATHAVALRFSKVFRNSGNRSLGYQNPHSLNLGTSAMTIRTGTDYQRPASPPAERPADVGDHCHAGPCGTAVEDERRLLPLPLPALRRNACDGQPATNLAHCFCCQKNINNIDLLLSEGYDFRAAVALLERWLKQYQVQQGRKKTARPAPS